MASWSAFRGVRLRELDKKASVGSVLPEIDFSIDPNSLQALSKKFQAFPGAVQEAIVEATEKTRRYTRSEIIRALKVVASLKPAYISRGVAGGKAKRRRASAAGGGRAQGGQQGQQPTPQRRRRTAPQSVASVLVAVDEVV